MVIAPPNAVEFCGRTVYTILHAELDAAGVMVSRIVVLAVNEPEVPVMVTVAVPTVAVLLAASASALVAVAGLVAKVAVTPLGNPEAVRVTEPVNPFRSVTVMESGAVRPSAIDTAGAAGASVKLAVGLVLTVRAMAVLAVRVPEVPVMVTVAAPTVAVLLAVRVTTLLPVAGLVANTAVTPLGRPVAARVTEPVNPPKSVTVMVSVVLLPCGTDRVGAEGASVKLGGVLTTTVSATVVDAVRVPEVPVMVIAAAPTVAALPAVRVTTLLPVVGLVANAAVTPLGNPDAASATLPVNPPRSVTVTVSVALLPCKTDRVEADGAKVKLAGVLAATVSDTVAVSVSEPEVPVMVTADVPMVAALLAASVSTLLPVAGLVPKVAVTPLGNPDAARVTLPANGLMSVMGMASVALLPCVTVSADAEGASVKLPVAVVPQVFPLMANAVGIALVTPFQVPLNPNPLVLPPAATRPL
jgi:hypothetical protein